MRRVAVAERHHSGWVDQLPRGDFELAAELRRFRELRDRDLPGAVTGAMDKATAELVASYFTDLVVTVGEAAPPFSLPDARGKQVSLGNLLQDGPVVLVFYRGVWCPFCNIHLRALQRALPRITALGATLVAVSGQTPDRTLETIERNDIGFPVLSDTGLAVARSYGLAFELPGYLREVYSGLGHPVPEYNCTAEHILPIPATFVIDTGAVVRFAHADPDYRYRADPADVLAALREVVR